MADQLMITQGEREVVTAIQARSASRDRVLRSAGVETRRSRARQRRKQGQRVSKWDRPPDPHDWRYFVGNIGKVLIATGILMFSFVAYQLWGTGIETARAQSSLKKEFQELVVQRPSGTPPSGDNIGPTGADARADQPGGPTDGIRVETVDDVSSSSDQPDPATMPDADGSDSVNPPSINENALLVPVAQDIPPILRGDPLALLEIPAIGIDKIVVPGVSLDDLKAGPGHYPDTPLPGQLGNAAIAGHRTTYGAPFFDVDDLVPGDEIIVTMITGDRFVYEVTGVEVVSATDYWVVRTSDPTIAELTLTSCDPKWTATNRIIVHSLLNPDKSSNVGLTTPPYELEQDDEAIPGDDPVVVTDSRAGAPADDGASVEMDASGDADVQRSTAPARADNPASDDPGDASASLPDSRDADLETAAATPSAAADAEVGDAFSQGWFDDRAAFPEIALWGMALTLISVSAYRVSRRFRHDSIGLMVGIFPFLFALYFFFQNVNRLLPPGL